MGVIESMSGTKNDETDDVIVNRSGPSDENVSAKNEIKSSVEEAIDSTLSKVLRDRTKEANATSENGTRSNESGVTSTLAPTEEEVAAAQDNKAGARTTTVSPTTLAPTK